VFVASQLLSLLCAYFIVGSAVKSDTHCDFLQQVGQTSVTTSLSGRTATCTKVEDGIDRALMFMDTTTGRSELHSSETSAAGNRTVRR